LGVVLFERGTRGMELTAAGQRLRGWARTLLDQADAAVRDVRDERPVLRLGVDVDVHTDRARDGLLRGVLDGQLDAALLLDAGDDIGGLGFEAPAGPLSYLDLEAVPLALVA